MISNNSRMKFWDECVFTALRGRHPEDGENATVSTAIKIADLCLKQRDARAKELLKRKPGTDVGEGKSDDS